MPRLKAIVSKREALRLITAHIRRPDIRPAQLIKLLTLQAKLSGWLKRGKGTEDEPETTIEQRVIALERKRRDKAQKSNNIEK
jgi:hypothetical protein